jgi:[acyl-carrier-protein] S-malonyltransferase
MKRLALLFAGQGAQVVGMGKDLAENYPTAKALFEQANQILGYDLTGMCHRGPEMVLTKTEHAQPGIFLVSWIAYQLFREACPDLEVEAAAGLSLGEFTALVAGGVLPFAEGLRLVRRRGLFMQEACEITRGSMAAIIGLDEAGTRAVCEEAGVELANLNCPGQLVISGEAECVIRASELAKARGAKRALVLPVAGAYHSRLMISAQDKLRHAMEGLPWRTPSFPVMANVTARPHDTAETIRELMVQQVTSPVRWEESMRHLVQQGCRCFLELGPGTALSGFIRRIDRTVEILNVADVASLENTIRAFQDAPEN